MSYHQLTREERYQIYILKREGHSQRQIAAMVGRSASTISREFRRNCGGNGWRPGQAHDTSHKRRVLAYKATKVTAEVKQWIETLLRQDLSPQQIVDYLKAKQKVSLHHETVYQLIYANKVQGGDWFQHLRVASKPYRKRYGHNDRRGKLRNRVGIEHRPAIIDRRSRIGDWEGDTVIFKGKKGALLTLVERKTLYTVIVRLPGKQATPVADAAIAALSLLSERHPVKSITFDNGLEFAEHERIAEALGVQVYFAHPHASWERGTNENTNGLIRQYFPKGVTRFEDATDEQVQFVMDRLNNRPRRSRGGYSPNELFMGRSLDLLAA